MSLSNCGSISHGFGALDAEPFCYYMYCYDRLTHTHYRIMALRTLCDGAIKITSQWQVIMAWVSMLYLIFFGG